MKESERNNIGRVDGPVQKENGSMGGEWVNFKKGTDFRVILDLVDNPGDFSVLSVVLENQLKERDAYLYFIPNEHSEKSSLSFGILNGGDQDFYIIAPHNDLFNGIKPEMWSVLREKWNQFPNRNEFEKCYHDMFYLDRVEKVIESGEKLNTEEMIFIFELRDRITSFEFTSSKIRSIRSKLDYLEYFDKLTEESDKTKAAQLLLKDKYYHYRYDVEIMDFIYKNGDSSIASNLALDMGGFRCPNKEEFNKFWKFLEEKGGDSVASIFARKFGYYHFGLEIEQDHGSIGMDIEKINKLLLGYILKKGGENTALALASRFIYGDPCMFKVEGNVYYEETTESFDFTTYPEQQRENLDKLLSFILKKGNFKSLGYLLVSVSQGCIPSEKSREDIWREVSKNRNNDILNKTVKFLIKNGDFSDFDLKKANEFLSG